MWQNRTVDLVIYAGPVIIKPAFRDIPWKRETEIVPIVGSGSTYFGTLAGDMRDSTGRMLPNLLRRYAGVDRQDIDKLALCAFSAGWGLLNRLFQNDDDRAEVDACVLSDAAFGTGLHGHAMYATDAMLGRHLMVATTTNNSANPSLGIMKTGRDTWLEIESEAKLSASEETTFRAFEPEQVAPRNPMPPASGGVWRTGKACYWYDYTAPMAAPGTGNDFTHVEHHDLAVEAWTAYLIPYFAGAWLGVPWKVVAGVGAAAAGVVGAAAIWRYT